MFNNLMDFWKSKQDKNPKKPDENVDKNLEHYKSALKNIVYDESLIDELAPIFSKLHDIEGFDKVFGLLEAKEQQINQIVEGEWFKQISESDTASTDNENNNEEDSTQQNNKGLSASDILKSKYNK